MSALQGYALLWLTVSMTAVVPLPFLVKLSDQPVIESQSIVETETQKKEDRDRASGEERPGVAPPESIKGSQSGTTTGRAENPWNTRGRPLRGDPWD